MIKRHFGKTQHFHLAGIKLVNYCEAVIDLHASILINHNMGHAKMLPVRSPKRHRCYNKLEKYKRETLSRNGKIKRNKIKQ